MVAIGYSGQGIPARIGLRARSDTAYASAFYRAVLLQF